MADEGDQVERQPIGYMLVITVAGPNFQDEVVLESDDLLELHPQYQDYNGLTFERYPGETDEEWTEVRFDYVVERRLTVAYETPQDTIIAPSSPEPPGWEPPPGAVPATPQLEPRQET